MTMLSRLNRPRRVFGAVLLTAVCCLAALGVRFSRAQAPEKKPDPWAKFTYQESDRCSQCHTFPKARYEESLQFVLLTEYAIWKTHDKHALAYVTLNGKRSREMGRRLGYNVDQEANWTEKAGCFGCHAMGDLSKENLAKGARRGLDPRDGVSCDGCHGPSSGWEITHTRPEWREKTPEQKYQEGMRDLRDPVVRARLCMSCHVGDAAAGRVVTHAMFAAGHPPLPPIEIATFSRNEPKHWRDAKDVPAFQHPSEFKPPINLKNYHAENAAFQQTRLAAVGDVVALAENMRLAAERTGLVPGVPRRGWPELSPGMKEMGAAPDAEFQAAIRRDWPEVALAHSDCYSCHHDLRYPGFRQERGFGYQLPGRALITVRPGRVLVRSWPLAGLEAALVPWKVGGHLPQLETDLGALAGATKTRSLGDPAEVRKAAENIVGWCRKAEQGLLPPGDYTADSALRLLKKLCREYAPPKKDGKERPAPLPDYESARLVASLTRVVYEDWADKQGLSQAQRGPALAVLGQFQEQFDLEPYFSRGKRTELVLGAIKEVAVGKLSAAEEKSFQEFANYLRPENIGKPSELKKMMDNSFLSKLDRGVSNEKFTAALLRQKTIDALQQFNKEEEEVELKRLAEYNPRAFRECLEKLDRALPAAK
jgi:hypothetical protein